MLCGLCDLTTDCFEDINADAYQKVIKNIALR